MLNTVVNVVYNVITKHEITILIKIFFVFNLNYNKHLNLLAFKEAFLFYSSYNTQNRLELVAQIEKIKVTRKL